MQVLLAYSSADGITSKTLFEVGLDEPTFCEKRLKFQAANPNSLPQAPLGDDAARKFDIQMPWLTFLSWLKADGVSIELRAAYMFGTDNIPDPAQVAARAKIVCADDDPTTVKVAWGSWSEAPIPV